MWIIVQIFFVSMYRKYMYIQCVSQAGKISVLSKGIETLMTLNSHCLRTIKLHLMFYRKDEQY